MKTALSILAHQLRLPAKSRDILMGVLVIAIMTLAMGFLEFTHRHAWIEPALNIIGILVVAQLIVYLILLQRRIRRERRERRDMLPPGEMVGVGVPIGPRKPGPLTAHAVPPNEDR